jgi:hypothetical protein
LFGELKSTTIRGFGDLFVVAAIIFFSFRLHNWIRSTVSTVVFIFFVVILNMKFVKIIVVVISTSIDVFLLIVVVIFFDRVDKI